MFDYHDRIAAQGGLRPVAVFIGATFVLSMLIASYTSAQEQNFSLVLHDGRADATLLTTAPEVLSGEAIFHIDAGATRIRIDIISDISNLDTEIWYPGGQDPIDPSNVDLFNGSYTEFEVEQTGGWTLVLPGFAVPGFHYVYSFDSQGPGDYQVCFDGSPDLEGEDDALVITQLFTDSPIQAGLLATPLRAKEGDDVTLTAFLFDGEEAITGATVNVQVKDPDSEEYADPFALLDDGNGADAEAGDGLYSGTFTPQAGNTGQYDVLAELTGQGDAFFRQVYAAFEVYAPPAVFNTDPSVVLAWQDDNSN